MDDKDSVLFVNSDVARCSSVTLRGDKVNIVGPTGKLELDKKRVTAIVMRAKDRRVPKVTQRTALVGFTGGTLSCDIEELNEKALLAKTEFAGRIAIKRKEIRFIKFNPK